MRRLTTAVTCVCLIASNVSVGGQQRPPLQSGVSLVTVDVTVLDKDGRPVPGLTAEDFEVKLNGKVQAVRAASFVRAAAEAAAPAAPSVPPTPSAAVANAGVPAAALRVSGRTVTNVFASAAHAAPTASVPSRKAEDPGEPRVFIILVDDLSFTPQRGKALFLAAQRFIDRLPASDRVGFTTSSGLGAVNPTAERAAVRAALEKVVGQFSDPRSLGGGGPSSGRGPGASDPDGGASIDEALDIDGPNPGLLKDVIIRECFNGSPALFGSRSLEQVIAEDRCASQLQSEARRTAALTRQNVDRQIRGYTSVIEAMKVASGIRHLILVSDGVAIHKDTALLTPMARAAAEAGVQVSMMAEEPDLSLSDTGRRDVGAFQGDARVAQPDTGRSQRRRNDDRMLVAGAQTVAEVTGGIFYRVIGSPDGFFDRIAVASSAVYRLGVEPPPDARSGRSFTVVVSLRQKSGLTIHTNRHAVALAPAALPATPSRGPSTAPAAPVPLDEQLRSAVIQAKALAGVPLAAAAMARRSASAPGQVDVTISIQVPGSVKGPVTTMLGLVDEGGTVRTASKAIDVPPSGSDHTTTFLVPLAPGAYTIRFAAADHTGAIGNIEWPIRASLSSMGPFTVSDLLTWHMDTDGKAQLFAVEDVPPSAKTLNVSIELYLPDGASLPEDMNVKWRLVPDGQDSAVIEHEAAPNTGTGLLRADAAIEMADLPEGLYTLHAAMLIDGAAVGQASTTIRKR